jgi:hypothetical protein
MSHVLSEFPNLCRYTEVGSATIFPGSDGVLDIHIETTGGWKIEEYHVYIGESVPFNNPGISNWQEKNDTC